MSQYIPKPFKYFGGNINMKVDLSNYATKTDPKYITHVDTSKFELKTKLASLKTEIDKLDVDKLAPVSVELSKLIDVVKKAVYEKLPAKVNNIDISEFVLEAKYKRDKTELEKKIPDVTELEDKIPDINCLVKEAALTAVKNTMPNVSSLVKKIIYDSKISELKKNLLIIIMTNILLLQSSIL